jgi:hypothetical protein
VSERICGEAVTLPLKWGGEICICVKDYRHVFSPDSIESSHLCDCPGQTMWTDDQQWDEAKSKRETP